MNALIRIPVELVVPEVNSAAPLDFSLLGVGAAIALWGLLHAALAISWMSAGTV